MSKLLHFQLAKASFFFKYWEVHAVQNVKIHLTESLNLEENRKSSSSQGWRFFDSTKYTAKVSNDSGMAEETNLESDLDREPTALLKTECLQIDVSCTKTSSCVRRTHKGRFLSFFKSCLSRTWPRKLPLTSAYRALRHTMEEREEISRSVPSPSSSSQGRSPVDFIKQINWASLVDLCHEWIKHPMNIALLLWSVCVAVSSSMQGLLLLGMLNKEFPALSSRNRWIEINNQVLNALFTLMSLYQHPSLFHHLVLLCRWRPEDIIELRKVYSKNAARRTYEWTHMLIILTLLHLTCFSQYVLCGLYWGYTIATRPEFVEDLFNAIGFVAPVLAGAYAICSPLGRELVSDKKEEDDQVMTPETTSHRVAVSEPEWNGGLFDCRGETSVGCLSFFCTFCIFGWNMERLGFGNMYVHIAMFFLLCFAPLWIFGISALHISNDTIRDIVAMAGLVLSLCGLLYGGYWRIQMRKRFKLRGNGLCCCSETAADYARWLLCCSCSLAQEVRTANLYEVEDGVFCRKVEDVPDEAAVLLCPLPRERRSKAGMGTEYDFDWKWGVWDRGEMVRREDGVEDEGLLLAMEEGGRRGEVGGRRGVSIFEVKPPFQESMQL
ncbi:hypothetical protein HPP92_012010 [Vanilla planifolia]|uniref:PLAC8 family protein n=1 Tax=Vanilla planifolia TaxID=51239 RepID=A0A835R870_VANPL|nr:hypothetical protein HPP92_012010 [Vanilla planifolia]